MSLGASRIVLHTAQRRRPLPLFIAPYSCSLHNVESLRICILHKNPLCYHHKSFSKRLIGIWWEDRVKMTSKLNFFSLFFWHRIFWHEFLWMEEPSMLREILKMDPDMVFSYFRLLVLSLFRLWLLQRLTINIRYQLPIIFRSFGLEKYGLQKGKAQNGSADLWALQRHTMFYWPQQQAPIH